jgi:uncharacterized protein with HEPN domain
LTVSPRVLLALKDMRDYAEKAASFLGGRSTQELEEDEVLQFAILRALELVGEASRLVPAEVRDLVPEIPWSQIAAMRNKLIHHYFGVKLDVVRETAANDAPALVKALNKLLADIASV